MTRLWFGVLLLGGLAACETGYQLDGQIVPEDGVDPTRQLLVLLSVDREAELGQLLITTSSEGQHLVKEVDQIGAAPVSFSYRQLGCPKQIQIVAVAPKTSIVLPGPGRYSPPPPTALPLVTGDDVATTQLLSASPGCGSGSETQHVSLSLTADEWMP